MLLNKKLKPGQKRMLFQWDRAIEDQPIFTSAGGKLMTANDYTKHLHDLGTRAGFPHPVTQHDFQAANLSNIGMFNVLDLLSKLTLLDENPKYSDTQRQTMAGHHNNAIQHQFYAGTNPNIDGQATYLRKPVRIANIAENFRELDVEWNPELWQTLPLALKEKLAKTSEYVATKAELQDTILKVEEGSSEEDGMSDTMSDTPESGISLDSLKRRLRRERKNLEKTRLEKFWDETKSGITAGSEVYNCRGVNHPFSRLAPIIPKRRQLADALLKPARLRSPEGTEALRLLVDVYHSTSEIYRPGLDTCPCGKNSE
jgi:hypothetical protein